MNILLSAYACEPNKGSEPGLGWNWCIEIAKRGHTVYVLTRTSNKALIQSEIKSLSKLDIHFIYYDLPSFILKFKKKIGINLYYLIWQIGIYFHLKKKITKFNINLIHHITFGVFKYFSGLSFINIPFVFGPVGGGQMMPLSFFKNLNFRDKTFEIFRSISIYLSLVNIFQHLMYNKCLLIFVTNRETLNFIPNVYKNKVKIVNGIGIPFIKPNVLKNPKPLKILHVGRILPWKGTLLLVEALNIVNKKCKHLVLDIVGRGQPNYVHSIQKYIKNNDIKNINWHDWVSNDELANLYGNADLFVFTSLHESSGMVIFEAISYGLPVISFNLGGPNHILNENCLIMTDGLSQNQVIESLAQRIISIISNQNEYVLLKEQTHLKSVELLWSNIVENVYKEIEISML